MVLDGLRQIPSNLHGIPIIIAATYSSLAFLVLRLDPSGTWPHMIDSSVEGPAKTFKKL